MVRPAPLDDVIRRRMTTTKRRDTAPERELRSLLHREGLRFRIDRAPVGGLRSRADIVFTSARVAVFVNGCFWHGCVTHGTWPKNNADWWRTKIEGNQARDQRVDKTLRAAGWRVFRVWEHDDMPRVSQVIAKTVRGRRS